MTDNADKSAPKPLRIGVAGLGTVGAGVLKIFERHGETLEARAGRPLEVVAVSARNRTKDRGVDLSAFDWEDDPVALARREDIDVVIEVIGGSDGPAKVCAEAALGRGAHLVTANKAMMAHHAEQLSLLAEKAGAALRFEAAVAGGIPIVKALAEGLAANAVDRVYGVLNGTCNFILTEMEKTGRDYSDILAEAQEKGYAEADPTADVGGFDAAQKLALLAGLGFARRVDYAAVEVEGIERVALADIHFARELGFRIKQLASAERVRDADGVELGVLQRVAPCLLPISSAVAGLDNVTNAVVVEGDFVGQTVYEGPGAGEGPTASAIVADVLDIARGDRRPAFGQPYVSLDLGGAAAPTARSAYYLRLSLIDQPGALAKVTAALGDDGVSIDQMRQFGRKPDPATVLIVTHDLERKNLTSALAAIEGLSVCLAEPVALRIERP